MTDYDPPPAQPRTGLLLALGLAWLAAILWVAHASIMADTRLTVTTAAIALPTVIATSLLAGAIAGLATVSTLTSRGVTGMGRPLPRTGLALAAGLGTAGLGAVTILVTYGAHSSLATLAVAVVVAGALGGTLGALRPAAVAAAGFTATLGVFVVGFVLRLFKEPLLVRFGAGRGPASWESASGWFALTDLLASGLTAGLVAYWHLRGAARAQRDAADRAGTTAPAGSRWPAYLAAGATPGLMLLLAEVVTRLGGGQLLRLAGSVSELDQASFVDAGSARIRQGLAVLFIGAVSALIAFGRTLPRHPEPERPGLTPPPGRQEELTG